MPSSKAVWGDRLVGRPLNHNSSPREIESVWIGGEHYSRTKLDAMLRIVAERAAPAWTSAK